MLLIVIIPKPVFVSVTVCEGLLVKTTVVGNVSVVGESVSKGSTPVPLKDAVCGLPGALSVTLREAVREPVVEGVKVTLMVQLAPADNEAGQLFVSAKSPPFVPVMPTEVMVRVPLPLLVKVVTSGLLSIPTV